MGIITPENEKGWLENAFNTVMGLRKLPQNIGLDAARNLLGLGAGGLLRDPGKYTSSAFENLGQSAKATIDPVTSAIRRARQSALESLDAEPMEGSGTTPSAGGALPVDYRAPDRSAAPALALPTLPASRRVPRVAAPPVAAPSAMQNIDSPPTEETDAFPAYRAPATAVPAVPAQPRQSYTDMFKEILAQKQADLKAPLSEDQKRALQLQFFLAMMSNSSKPGARIFGAMGDAGQTTLSAQQGMEKENLNRAEKARARQIEEAYKMLGVRNLDEDNLRADRREAAETKFREAQEKRFETQDKRDQRRLDIEEKTLNEAGKKVTGHVMLGNGNIGLITGKGVVDSKIKGKVPASDTDPLDRGIQSLRRLFPGEDNEALFNRYLGTKRATGDVTEKDVLARAMRLVEATKGIDGPTMSLQEAMGVVRGAVSGEAPRNQKPDPGPNKGRVWIDDTTKERFKSDGKTWVKVK